MAREPILPPTYFLTSLVLMAVLHLGAPGATWLGWPWRAFGFPLLFCGVLLNGRSANLFEREGTTIKPFQSSTALVTEGPFRYSRNPMYLGMVCIQTGLALLLGTATPWAVIVVFPAVMTVRFIIPEERALEASYGDAYRAYASRVRRWI